MTDPRAPESRPEHDRSLMHADDYYACEQPERPAGGLTWFERRCRSCVLAMGTAAAQRPHWTLVNETSGEAADTAAFYEQYRHEHGLPPLPAIPSRELLGA